MPINTISDTSQLQAAFKYLKIKGLPYWSGSIDGVMNEQLIEAIRQFQSNNNFPVSGFITSNNEDKTRQKIIQLCSGTPFANMRGLYGSNMVFSLMDVPTILVQEEITGLGLWQETMHWLYTITKFVSGIYSLPLKVDPESLEIVTDGKQSRLAFSITFNDVLWLSNGILTFNTTIPPRARELLAYEITSDHVSGRRGTGNKLDFITTNHYEFFKKVPAPGAETIKLLKAISDFAEILYEEQRLTNKAIELYYKFVAQTQQIYNKIKANNVVESEKATEGLKRTVSMTADIVTKKLIKLEDLMEKVLNYVEIRSGKDVKNTVDNYSRAAEKLMNFYEAWELMEITVDTGVEVFVNSLEEDILIEQKTETYKSYRKIINEMKAARLKINKFTDALEPILDIVKFYTYLENKSTQGSKS